MSPSLHYRVSALIAFAVIGGGSLLALAEQPPATPPPLAESKAAPPSRVRPQVIYHLPRTSSYAATLHSQAKGQSSNALPIDSTMPVSLQMSRAAANAAAAQAQQEPTAPSESPNPAETSRARTVKRAKVQSHRAAKGQGSANSPRDKSNKK